MTIADSTALKNALKSVRDLIRPSLKNGASVRPLTPKSLEVLDYVHLNLTGMMEREKRRQNRRKARRQRLKNGAGIES